MVGGAEVSFNPKAIRWLGVLLDQCLTLKPHHQDRLQKAKRVEGQIKALSKQQGLPPGALWRIHKATAQAVALYGAELWWQGQKDRARGLQTLINQQARAITGAFRTTLIGPLVREAALEPAVCLLEARQQGYIARLLALPDDQPTRGILPITFRDGDLDAQPGEQPLQDREWAGPRAPKALGQYLAWKAKQALGVDPPGGFERISQEKGDRFPGEIRVLPREEALEEACQASLQTNQPPQALQSLTLWSDGSRLEDGRVGAGVAWRPLDSAIWKTRPIPIGCGAEVFDAELQGAVEALRIAYRDRHRGPIRVFIDSQAAIRRLRHTTAGPGQGLAIQACQLAKALIDRGQSVQIQWVPGHNGAEGNEQADQAAKLGAERAPRGQASRLTLAYLRRLRTKAATQAREAWLNEIRPPQGSYRPQQGWKLDPALAKAPKALAARFIQLKTGHAAIGPYLQRIQARDSPECLGCGEPRETVPHLLFECREWTSQRRAFLRALQRVGTPVPTLAEAYPAGRILGDRRATLAILGFLRDTTIGARDRLQQAEAQARRSDEWGLEALEEAYRRGEG